MEVIHIDSTNSNIFNDLVKNRHSIIKAYSPTCIHCIAMSNEWDKVQEMMIKNKKINQDNKPLLISLRNDALHLLNHPITEHVYGFPTIIELKEDGSIGQQYVGPRTSDEMSKWIMDKLRNHTKIQRGGNANKKHMKSARKTIKTIKNKHANKKHMKSTKKIRKTKHANKKHMKSARKTRKTIKTKHANKKHMKSAKKQ